VLWRTESANQDYNTAAVGFVVRADFGALEVELAD
jgi:hypothetical protein